MKLFLLVLSLILLVIVLKPRKKLDCQNGNYRDTLNKLIEDMIPDNLTTYTERKTFKDAAKLIMVFIVCLIYLFYIIWYMMAYSYIGNSIALVLSAVLIIQTLFNVKKLFNVIYGTDEIKLNSKVYGFLFRMLDVVYIGYVIVSIILNKA